MREATGRKFGVCLLLPPHLEGRLVQTAEALPVSGQAFRIDAVVRRPHLTIYMATFDKSRLRGLIETLRSVSTMIDLPTCTAYGLTITAGGYLEVGYYKTSALVELQGRIVEAAGTFRDGQAERGNSHLESAMGKRYGYKFAGDAFRPHVTLAAYRTERISDLPSTLPAHYDFSASALALAAVDNLGAIREVLWTSKEPRTDV